jgi:hypothetical protein
MSSYFVVDEGRLRSTIQPPVGLIPIVHGHAMLLPPLAAHLHRNFRTWGNAGFSPGPITPQRVFIGSEGQLAFSFADGQMPNGLLANVGAGPDLAAWLVLLDKWMATQDVIESARALWSTQELATALPFVTPAFLPASLVSFPPQNWVRTARAIALALLPTAAGAQAAPAAQEPSPLSG